MKITVNWNVRRFSQAQIEKELPDDASDRTAVEMVFNLVNELKRLFGETEEEWNNAVEKDSHRAPRETTEENKNEDGEYVNIEGIVYSPLILEKDDDGKAFTRLVVKSFDDGEYYSSFIRGKQAQDAVKNLTKGMTIAVSGFLAVKNSKGRQYKNILSPDIKVLRYREPGKRKREDDIPF